MSYKRPLKSSGMRYKASASREHAVSAYSAVREAKSCDHTSWTPPPLSPLCREVSHVTPPMSGTHCRPLIGQHRVCEASDWLSGVSEASEVLPM